MLKQHLTSAEIEAGLPHIKQSPPNEGTVEMIVARPADDERVVLEVGQFSVENGLEGDNWRTRGSKHTADGSAHPEMQIAVTNARMLQLLAGEKKRWPLAGDQLVVDLDLSDENLQAGQQLQAGTAVLEVTSKPHNGCKKFADRYGVDAIKFVNSATGRQLRMRGLYVRVVQPGQIQVGDTITKI